MRVLFIASHGIEFASTRLRIHQFMPFLEAQGIECRVRPFLSTPDALKIYAAGGLPRKLRITAAATVGRVYDVVRAARVDIAFVMREAFPFGPPIVERALKAAAGRLIFDFDDAIWLPSSIYPNPLDRLRDWDKPGKIMRFADHVIAGSPLHLAYTTQHVRDPRRVSVMPTVVDTTVYTPRPHDNSGEITVGWIGTPRNTGYLNGLMPAMRTLTARNPKIRFKFVGAAPFDCPDLPVAFKTWRLDEEVSDIQSFDIGIMPLPDDEHARGKCGLKLIEYMSCGLPVVCSPVGFNCGLVDSGGSGYFATTPDEWTRALEMLAADAALRRRLGAHGRERIIAEYSAAVMAPRLLHVLEETLSSSAQPGPGVLPASLSQRPS